MNRPIEAIKGRKLRFALAGCGRVSMRHFQAMSQFDNDIELVSVCDNNPTRLEQASKEQKAPGYDNLTALLEQSDPDLVVLSTPSGIHAAQAIEAAEAGCHVMTEKPMATRWNDGLAMTKACEEAGVQLFVVKQNRCNPTIQLLKQAIDKNRFGRIYSVQLSVFWTRPQEYYDQDAWRGTWEFDGGALMNQASHYVDLLDWLIGPVESVQAMTNTLARRIEVEDTAVVNIRWRSGALGAMNVSMLTYPKNFEGSITILGEKGTVRLGGVAVNEIQHWEFEDKDEHSDAQVDKASYETTSVYGFGHPLYYENVIQVLRGVAQPEINGREGLRSLELLVAAYLSARDGRRVSLPLEA